VNDTIFGGKVIENKMCFLIYSTTLSEIFFVRRRIQLDVIVSVHRSSCEVPFIRDRFLKNMKFLNRFSKNNIKFYENSSSVIRVVPCRRADGQTDRQNLIVGFRNFVKAPKNDSMF